MDRQQFARIADFVRDQSLAVEATVSSSRGPQGAFRVRPRWLRYSDFTPPQPTIIELTETELVALGLTCCT